MFRALAAPAIALALILPSPLAAQETLATLTVTGQGTASAIPDTGHIRAGVETTGKTAAEALAANNALATRVIAALKEGGVEDRDIQTGTLRVSPQYGRATSGQVQPPNILGYSVVNEVIVTIRDLKTMGAVLDQVVQSGANRINAISFGLEDDQPVRDQARRAAVADARRAAALLAEAAGVKLKRILSITVGGGRGPGPVPQVQMRMAAEAVPIEAGEQTLGASVTIVWEIE
ncbi:MAG: SIMPL domain-containing protein [Paracoccaceae bacterium]|nr:SIMPL domain-containing protein [Paracoccaceae bacterium]